MDVKTIITPFIRFEEHGAVTLRAGCDVATYDGHMQLDRDVTYPMGDPMPHSFLNGSIELMEASRQAGQVFIPGFERTVLLETSSDTWLFGYRRRIWVEYTNNNLAKALRVLLSC